ncbi:MAG: histidinol-phosphatase HisJ family protein [Oscillospiraceae bacterium]|nr:histidinol-phosphatase HisJ family protein [Oscillospiraceae bacterium]
MRFDMHVHSSASGDCSTEMEETVQEAVLQGLSGLCFTDHCDLISGVTPGKRVKDCYTDWAKSYRAIERVRTIWGDRIEILHGMELAEMVQDPERARECAAAPGLDFLLGSVHALTGKLDFFYLDIEDQAACHQLADLYLDENIGMAELNLMDVIAHVGYFNRYISKKGFWIDMMEYEEKLRHLFGILVQNGRGIELNTSGMRRDPGPHFTIPDLPVLRLFRECGGEIVTTGSDAHMAKHVGSHLAEAEELLRAAGFRYTTVFRQRKPTFIPL